MSSDSSRASTSSGFYKLPPIITSEADRLFLNEVNAYIELELSKFEKIDAEQRYIVYKTVFNKVIEHVTAYRPVLTSIKKEYEDTIETIKKGQREAAFLQGKLKAMASEPSTLRNYKKRADELEERIVHVKSDNERLRQELAELQSVRAEREKRPKTAETPKRELKKDSRLIPGLSLEETTDMKVLQKKYETLDRQLKELNLSLRARYLPKTHKLQLKDTLDNKVAYRDQLLFQSQVYKAKGQRLKIALEAAQAYNQMKPPHQTVGDAVIIAFHQASGMLKAEREKADGEQSEASQTSTFEDDDPNKEKEAEMMLEYIEKFNELFEDGLFEEAAVHAANSPKGILRTQATLAKFRDVKVKTRGRSPLLAFCDALMSSVKAAGSKPNEALSMDCMAAGLQENRLDLANHWLSQDRLTLSHGLGMLITEHCSCPTPCMCGCQALAQNVFVGLKSHDGVIVAMLKQGKSKGALLYARQWFCVTSENVEKFVALRPCRDFVEGLMEAGENDEKPILNLRLGKLLMVLMQLKRPEVASSLILNMLKQPDVTEDPSVGKTVSLQRAVMLDKDTTQEEWSSVLEFLNSNGHSEAILQILAMLTVAHAISEAFLATQKDEEHESERETHDGDGQGNEDEDNESSDGMSVRSRHSTSMDRSSRESSPETPVGSKTTKESILKKGNVAFKGNQVSSSDKSPSPQKKKSVRLSGFKSPPPREAMDSREYIGTEHDNDADSGTKKRISFRSGGEVKFMNNDPYTSNPDSGDESEMED